MFFSILPQSYLDYIILLEKYRINVFSKKFIKFFYHGFMLGLCALMQINEKKYDTELLAAGVQNIYKYGVAFGGKMVEVVSG